MDKEVTAITSEAGTMAAGQVAPNPAQPIPVAILIVCRDDFEPDRLARHIAEASRGVATVSLVPVEAVAGRAPATRTAADYDGIAARIWQQLRQDDAARHAGVRDPAAAPGCNVASCEQTCNQVAAPLDAVTCGPNDTMCVAARSADGSTAALTPRDSTSSIPVQESITVVCAAGNVAMARRLIAHLAAEPDLAVRDEPIDDPDALFSYLHNCRPRLLVLDDAWLARTGASSARIHRWFPDVRVLVHAEEFSYELVELVLRLRFDGVLLSRCPGEACVRAVRAVHRGELWLPRALLARAVAERLQAFEDWAASRSVVEEKLTPREKQIVDLLRRGQTNKEIGRQLCIAEDTVKKHLRSVFDKLGVHRRTLAALR